MGGVEVLQPGDLINHHRRHHHHRNYNRSNFVSTSPMKSQFLPSANSGPSVARSSNRRKQSPPKSAPALPKVKITATVPLREKDINKLANHKKTVKPTTDLVIGQIKILKRGEVLPTSSANVDLSPEEMKKENKVGATTSGALSDLVVVSPSTDPLDLELKNIRISDFYAGSAFITSPEPSSLPVPVFFKKKDVLVDDDVSNTDYDATTGLRRLLRLELS